MKTLEFAQLKTTCESLQIEKNDLKAQISQFGNRTQTSTDMEALNTQLKLENEDLKARLELLKNEQI